MLNFTIMDSISYKFPAIKVLKKFKLTLIKMFIFNVELSDK